MKKYIKYFIFTALVSSFTISSFAQKGHQEVSVWGGGGLSSLSYNSKLKAGNHKHQGGGTVGVGYTHFFTDNMGLLLGGEVSFYNSKMEASKFHSKYEAVDTDGNSFQYQSEAKNYKEEQNTVFFNIPVMAQYETAGQNRFYGALGVKIGLPISKKYKVSKVDYTNTGYYGDEGYRYDDNPFFGFGKFIGKSSKGDLDLKVSYTLAVESGMKWGLTEDLFLYTGAYLDYGLNDINKSSGHKSLVEYNINNPQDFITNSALHSKGLDGPNTVKMVNSVHLFAVGLKVKLAFKL